MRKIPSVVREKPPDFFRFFIIYTITLSIIFGLHTVGAKEFGWTAIVGASMSCLIAGLFHLNTTGSRIAGRNLWVFGLGATIVWALISLLAFWLTRSVFNLSVDSFLMSNPSPTGTVMVLSLALAANLLGLSILDLNDHNT